MEMGRYREEFVRRGFLEKYSFKSTRQTCFEAPVFFLGRPRRPGTMGRSIWWPENGISSYNHRRSGVRASRGGGWMRLGWSAPSVVAHLRTIKKTDLQHFYRRRGNLLSEWTNFISILCVATMIFDVSWINCNQHFDMKSSGPLMITFSVIEYWHFSRAIKYWYFSHVTEYWHFYILWQFASLFETQVRDGMGAEMGII